MKAFCFTRLSYLFPLHSLHSGNRLGPGPETGSVRRHTRRPHAARALRASQSEQRAALTAYAEFRSLRRSGRSRRPTANCSPHSAPRAIRQVAAVARRLALLDLVHGDRGAAARNLDAYRLRRQERRHRNRRQVGGARTANIPDRCAPSPAWPRSPDSSPETFFPRSPATVTTDTRPRTITKPSSRPSTSLVHRYLRRRTNWKSSPANRRSSRSILASRPRPATPPHPRLPHARRLRQRSRPRSRQPDARLRHHRFRLPD